MSKRKAEERKRAADAAMDDIAARWGMGGPAAKPDDRVAAERDVVQEWAELLGGIPEDEPREPDTKSNVKSAPKMWHVDLGQRTTFKGPDTWENCFGKDSKCLDGPDGESTCMEVEVARRLSRIGWHGGWVNNYKGNTVPRHWRDGLVEADTVKRALPGRLAELAGYIGIVGTPDVVAWYPRERAERFLAIELKCESRPKPDKLSAEQVAWVRSAMRARLPRYRLTCRCLESRTNLMSHAFGPRPHHSPGSSRDFLEH